MNTGTLWETIDVQIVIAFLVVALLGSYVSKPYCDKLYSFALRGGRNPRASFIICYSLGTALPVILFGSIYLADLFTQGSTTTLSSISSIALWGLLMIWYHIFLAWFAKLNTVDKLKEFNDENT
ncbi:MAG: hypothetical protein R3F41_00020 [Gammaproteobacteria bacterium]|nr:hypothetical protein [Pseudomonadales bacterium]